MKITKPVMIKFLSKDGVGALYVKTSLTDNLVIEFVYDKNEATVFKNEEGTFCLIGDIEHWCSIPDGYITEPMFIISDRKYISEKSRVAKAGICMAKSLIETCHLLYLNDNCMEFLNGLIKPLREEFDRRLKNGGKHKEKK